MGDRNQIDERADLLADVAEMYFVDGLIQAEIAKRVGVTRSMISRMLTEARQQGIVEINIRRPLLLNRELAEGLVARFGLKDALVVANRYQDNARLLQLLGVAGAQLLGRYLRPGINLGIVWGTAMNALVEAIEPRDLSPITVVQLFGALGARGDQYDGHAIANRLAGKLGGEALYLNAPFLVKDQEMAASLNGEPGIREAITLARQCDIALLGIGATHPDYCSFCQSGNITPEDLAEYVEAGAVGNVFGRYFDIEGRLVPAGFYERIIGLSMADLMAIPNRMAVAGGPIKARSIEGILCSGYINILVTDSLAASQILEGPAAE